MLYIRRIRPKLMDSKGDGPSCRKGDHPENFDNNQAVLKEGKWKMDSRQIQVLEEPNQEKEGDTTAIGIPFKKNKCHSELDINVFQKRHNVKYKGCLILYYYTPVLVYIYMSLGHRYMCTDLG